MDETRRTAPVTQTIILAAGNGSRLAGAQGVPKPLMMVGGLPLIARALIHARESGCVEAVVVVGHEGEQVMAAIERLPSALLVRFVSVRDASRPNGVSLLAAEPFAAPQFFLQMVDHVFTRPALTQLVASPLGERDAGRVLVDCVPDSSLDIEDATKIRLDGHNRVVAIGKQVHPWDAIDAGCFALTREVFRALRRVPPGEPLTVSSGMSRLASAGSLRAVVLRDVEWADVDTPVDHERAERLLSPVGA